MQNYLVTVRLSDGSNEYCECSAFSEFDAQQKIGWAYVRDGFVVDVELND